MLNISKKFLSVLLIVIMVCSLFTIVPFSVSAYANIDGYPDFDVDIYVAGLMTDSDNPLYRTIENQISLDSPNDVVIKQLKEDTGFQASYAAWQIATFKGGDTVSDPLTEVGYYQSLILNTISEALTSSNVKNAFDNTVIKDAKHLQSTFTNILKLEFVFTDLNDLDVVGMSQDEQIKVMDAFSSSFKKTYPAVSNVGKFVSVFSTIVKEGKALETAINNLVAYTESVGMTDYMKAVVSDLYKNCDSSNVAMKSALFEIDKACRSYELAYSAATFDAAISSLSVVCENVVNTMVDGIMAANPAGLSIMIGQAIGKGVANFLFSTDAICEQYHKMCCLFEFEELLGKVTKLEMVNFSNSKTNYNANKIFSAVDFLYKEYDVSCDLAKKYADIIFEESIAGVFILNGDGYNKYVSSVEGLRTIAESNYEFLKGDAWTCFLEEDYPDIYEALIKEDDEIANPYIPVTGISFEKDSVEWGTENNFLFYDKATITPDNASMQSIEYTSSDPSVVSYNKFGAVVHKAGKATITSTSVSSGLTATLNVTVVDGMGADGTAIVDQDYSNPSITDSGQCGDNAYWKLYSDGTLYIYGSGDMYDYSFYSSSSNKAPWYSERSRIKTVIISQNITSIGSYAFWACASLTSIIITNSVASMDSGAFYGCHSLTNITIPDSVTSIGGNAFCYCTNLTSITIPDSVTSIGSSAFEYCTSLTSITIPDSVTSIDDFAFNGCTSLASIDVDINNQNYCSLNGNLYNKDKTELIQYSIGKNDTSFVIPDSVASIGWDVFSGCTSLTSVSIGKNVASIGGAAFSHCTNLTSITIPDSVTSIGYAAFEYCISLTSITIPDSVTSIGNQAFLSCTSLTSVTIGDGVASIGEDAFEGCTNLTSITIPDNVTDIWTRAFGYYYKSGYIDSGFKKISGFTIYGYTGSAAETYAAKNGFEFISLGNILNDNDTNISVTTDIDAELSVKALTNDESIAKANTALGENETLVSLFDIALVKDGATVQPEGNATVKIPCDNENAKVYRIEDDGTATDMNAVYENGYMVFTTEHFSRYALVVPNDNDIGDINGDGSVTVIDATMLQKYIAGLVTFSDEQLAVADTNGDGSVTVADATLIQKYLAGLVTSLG